MVLSIYPLFVFAPCGRKNEQQKIMSTALPKAETEPPTR